MRLFIAEKPSLGRAIAAALPQPQQKGQGWIRCGSGESADVVSWCIGHLLEPAEPATYDARWKRWRIEDLPLIPDQWQATPKPEVKQQLGVLKSLLARADHIVHAGDPDREGQLLVDEVLKYFNNQKPVQRLLISDLTPSAVGRALNGLRDNREFRRLSHSALARQRADWLYGINLTRFYTLTHQQRGEQGVYSVGRVQTPVLGLVVERDNTIDNFEPKPYFRVVAHCSKDQSGAAFAARWIPSEQHRASLDEEDRLLDRNIADAIAKKVQYQPGKVTEARFRDRKEAAPLPLSLSALQIEAGRSFRMGAKAVLDVAQSLYEKHQLITYPRSDCRYLPEGHFDQRHTVVNAISRIDETLTNHVQNADLDLRSATWNDSKVDAHHAIIPTSRGKPAGRLSDAEQKIYNLISRFYLMQFYPPAVHQEGKLTVVINNETFRASESAIEKPGWKAVELRQRDATSKTGENANALPRLEAGDDLICKDASVTEHQTQAPQPFTDATLLSAMTNIARFVGDPELRKTLRETDGLGTEATRAAIIETLFKRDFLCREKRFIRSTDKGRQMIGSLPADIIRPDMTALWEANLESIRRGEADPRAFLDQLKTQVASLVSQPLEIIADADTSSPATQFPHCHQCRAPMRKRSGKYGEFYACTRFPDCKGTRPLEEQKPTDGSSEKPVPCPHCFSPLVRRQGKKGWFWGCSNFPACRQTVNDDNGKPALSLRKAT